MISTERRRQNSRGDHAEKDTTPHVPSALSSLLFCSTLRYSLQFLSALLYSTLRNTIELYSALLRYLLCCPIPTPLYHTTCLHLLSSLPPSTLPLSHQIMHGSPASTSRPFLAPSLMRTLPSESFSMRMAITGSMFGAATDLKACGVRWGRMECTGSGEWK